MFTRTFATLAVFCAMAAHGQTSSQLSTTFLARGEQALLEVSIANGQPEDVPEISAVPNVTIVPTGRGATPRMLPGRRMEFAFEYIVSSYEIGKHTIPAIEVMVQGIPTTTEPVEFEVFDPSTLQWAEVQSGGNVIRYASSFRTLSAEPYENETTTAEIKLFVPEELFVEDWGIPEFEREGVTAWRFQPSPMRSRINLLGRRYISVAYPSTVTPTRTGPVSIGPAKIRLTTRETVMDPFPRTVNPEIYLDVPQLKLEAKPLPDGAPAGFENAVGRFRLAGSTAITEVHEGDPITVDLIVSGSGNLDTMKPPVLTETDGWKIYGTTTEQRGDERRQLSGSVIFHQSIRPLEMKAQIPPFRLVFFDPKIGSYQTLTTEPIALQMEPNPATPAPAMVQPLTVPVPLERMTDILAVLRTGPLTRGSNWSLPVWVGHAIAGLLALLLILKALWMRYGSRLRKDPIREARLRELREVEKSRSAGDTEFLKSAGGFIERWLGHQRNPEILAVLAERDAVCFRTEKPAAVLDRKRRSQILRVLRGAATGLVIWAAATAGPAAHADNVADRALEAFDAAKYDEATKLWLEAAPYAQLSANALYNIGNACYRSGSPGYAALYYRRALARDGTHEEARQNLRFLERKFGAITVQRPEYQYALSKLPLETWQNFCWVGLWLCGLALLVFPATRPGARLRVVAIGALVAGPLLVSGGALGWRYYPNDAEFAPVSRQAVIIAENVVLHTDAARTSPEVIDAPPGSLCEIIRRSGDWAYVAFATKTRGWVPIEAIEKIIPETAPTPPEFRKAKADGKTA